MMRILLFILMFFVAPITAEEHTSNPYKLITEQQSYPQARLKAFWSIGEQGFFAGVNDIKISYKIFSHPDKTKAIIVVSGRTESYIKYWQLAYELYQLGYSVYLYDHRGQGFSERLLKDREKGYVKQFDDYVQDLKTFYSHKVAPKNHPQKFIISHSMGGTIALLYAAKNPQNIQAIALSAPMLGLESEWWICPLSKSIVWINELLGRQPDYAPGQAPYNKPAFTPSDPAMMTHSRSRYQRSLSYNEQYPQIKLGGVTTHWLVQACQAMDAIKNKVSRLTVPILLLQASEDDVVSLSAQDDFCERLHQKTQLSCGGKSSKPKVLQGAYHELLIEEDRYRLPALNAILNFFKKFNQKQAP